MASECRRLGLVLGLAHETHGALAALSPIDNVYRGSVASTRATWDGEAAAWTGTIAAVMRWRSEVKRNVRCDNWQGGRGFYGSSCVHLGPLASSCSQTLRIRLVSSGPTRLRLCALHHPPTPGAVAGCRAQCTVHSLCCVQPTICAISVSETCHCTHGYARPQFHVLPLAMASCSGEREHGPRQHASDALRIQRSKYSAWTACKPRQACLLSNQSAYVTARSQ